MWTHSVVAIKPLASSAIMTNNLSVAFTTFAAGITAGLGTIYMIVFNGLLIGVIGMACYLSGMSLQLWSFVAPHGVLELPAIFIAAGAGLRLAGGLLFPGVLPRKESLARAGREAVAVAAGLRAHPVRRRDHRGVSLSHGVSGLSEISVRSGHVYLAGDLPVRISSWRSR